MFKLDDKFLEDLGLGALPEEQKQEFLRHIYSELEMRVGERLTDGMSDELLDEFGNFVDMNEEGMKKWFGENLPDYAEREDYQQLKSANPEAPENAVMSEYGAMKWLQLNRPDYPDVVAAVLEELKNEIRSNHDAILGGGAGQVGSGDGGSYQGGEDDQRDHDDQNDGGDNQGGGDASGGGDGGGGDGGGD
jgi:hypothetical protein